MDNNLYSFYNLLTANIIDEEGSSISINSVIIPIIQRDYAQGRTSPDVNRIREKFLSALKDAIAEKKPLNLDFVYGNIDENGNLTPLDGQQRLTTLYLLHWYAAKKEGIHESDYEFLKKFSYETRYSSRDFCEELIKYSPESFEVSLKDDIVNQSWFPLDWLNDQTIASMLVMIDCINDKFKDVDNLWSELVEHDAITFYFTSTKSLGLTDELYIKMNSRGKPLTRFEHFKAEFEAQLLLVDKNRAKDISKKIDQAWTDMLWNYRDEDQIDNLFLNLFKFVCDVICYKEGHSTFDRSYDEFDLIELYFSHDVDNVNEHILLFEKVFDAFAEYKGKTKEDLFLKYISKENSDNKIRVYDIADLDLFNDCLYNYMDKDSTRRSRSFPLTKFVLFYGFVVYVLNKDKVSDEQFAERIRIISNLVENSSDEIGSDSETRQGGNRIPAVLKQTDSIVCEGTILTSSQIDINFNAFQLSEEIEKQTWRINNPDRVLSINSLENHSLLHGQISIVDYKNHPEHIERFPSLMKCNRDLISCALLTYCDYSRIESGTRHSFGSKTDEMSWRFIFHNGKASGIEKTQQALSALLDNSDTFDDTLLQSIIDSYITKCEQDSLFDWKYYFVKYIEFRPESYGKYWIDPEDYYNPLALLTKKNASQNSYHPFLKIIDGAHIDRDDLGQRLRYSENDFVYCLKDGFHLMDENKIDKVEPLLISQNEDGIDIENRIEKYKSNPLIQ